MKTLWLKLVLGLAFLPFLLVQDCFAKDFLVFFTQGDVMATSPGKTDWKTVTSGDMLTEGSIVKTGDNSKAKLISNRGQVTRIGFNQKARLVGESEDFTGNLAKVFTNFFKNEPVYVSTRVRSSSKNEENQWLEYYLKIRFDERNLDQVFQLLGRLYSTKQEEKALLIGLKLKHSFSDNKLIQELLAEIDENNPYRYAMKWVDGSNQPLDGIRNSTEKWITPGFVHITTGLPGYHYLFFYTNRNEKGSLTRLFPKNIDINKQKPDDSLRVDLSNHFMPSTDEPNSVSNLFGTICAAPLSESEITNAAKIVQDVMSNVEPRDKKSFANPFPRICPSLIVKRLP